MAEDVVIRADGLGKKYAIRHSAVREPYTSLRDVVARGAQTVWRKTANIARGRATVAADRVEEFWALKDIGFEVKRGEVLGIIGRNGAGKSTLLKILSRITEPNEGRVTINGRVASLLEVGTGFHPELTGRENVYLNGAILGMTRAEIRRKFDEIVAFAEVEKFLDTPVKRYSSGMYVRLAFAVAAHLEPEILIVDEVLAVGDAEFQKKCLGKMDEVSRRDGRAVLFVSHNLAAIARMTDRALLLDSGSISIDGPVATALSTYLSSHVRKPTYSCPRTNQCTHPHVVKIEVFTSDPGGIHRFGEPLQIKFWIQHRRSEINGCFCFQIYNQFQAPVICSSYFRDIVFENDTDVTFLVCRFPTLLLNVGRFHLCTYLEEAVHWGKSYDKLDEVCAFEVIRTDEPPLAGWRPEACNYHEQHAWTASKTRLHTPDDLPDEFQEITREPIQAAFKS